jgi:hypothetical protein
MLVVLDVVNVNFQDTNPTTMATVIVRSQSQPQCCGLVPLLAVDA